MSKSYAILGIWALIGVVATLPALAQSRPEQGGAVAATLALPNPEPGPTEPVIVRVQLTNRSAEPLQVLKWHTPLEGFESDLFRVEHDGKPARYIGPLVKRGRPQPADYVTLAPGASLSIDLDLA